MKLNRKKLIQKRALNIWKREFSYHNQETELNKQKAIQFDLMRHKRLVVGILRSNIEYEENQFKIIEETMKEKKRAIFLNKWRNNLRFVKADNYRIERENDNRIREFRMKIAQRRVFEGLLNTVTQRKVKEQKDNIVSELKLKVNGWLEDFKKNSKSIN